MRTFLVGVLVVIALPISALCGAATDPLPERMMAFCSAKTSSPEDIAFLRSQAESGGAAECLARLLLFKFAPTENLNQFREYFAIDRRASKVVIASEEVNGKVNSLLREFKGRHPAEQMARVYLAFRRGHGVFKKADGSNIDLEMMFRGSVFAAVSAGGQDDVLRLSSEADRKELPNRVAGGD